MKIFSSVILVISTVLILGSLITNVVTLAGWELGVKQQLKEEIERKRPAKIKLTTITSPDCQSCWDANLLLDVVKQKNIEIEAEQSFLTTDQEAAVLLETYRPKRLPAVIMTGEVDKEAGLVELLRQAQAQKTEDAMVVAAPVPPYIDWPENKLRGLVDITLLDDQSCEECYDVKMNSVALGNFGVKADEAKLIDRGSKEGKALVKQYKITAVPTVIVNGDVEAYTALHQLWPQIGTIEEDGAHILRQPKTMGAYFDLTNNKIIKPE